MFTVLGAEPAIGRTFTEDEALPPAPTVVILSHGLWQQRYGARPDIIGRTLARAAIPGDQQVAVRAFHDPGGVVVLIMQRKDQLS
mgnify:CR=1 FL=1